jgi:nucleotide-binding universal stress UspA family protein
MFKKILVCLDGSTHSERILPYAIEQALHFGSKLVLLRVGSLTPIAITSVGPEQYRMVSSATVDIATRSELTEARSYLSRISKELAEKGLDVDVATILGPMAESIVKFIKDNSIDLVAMTSHAYKGWKRLMLGSAVDEILRECSVPVLVINQAENQAVGAR